MLECFLLKRKLYDCLDNSLSEMDRMRIKKHLDVCPRCQERLTQLKVILDYASSKHIPSPNNQFWYTFNAGLARRLDTIVSESGTMTQKPKVYRKPALVNAVLCVFFLAIGIFLFKFSHPTGMPLGRQVNVLVEEFTSSDEFSEASELNHEDDYLEEMDLLMQLELA